MDTLLRLESVASALNVKALRYFYDQLEFQVRGLKSLEIPVNSYGNLLSSLLMNRLPQEIRLLLSRQISDGEWQIEQLITILKRQITIWERASTTSNEPCGPQHLWLVMVNQSICTTDRVTHHYRVLSLQMFLRGKES